MRGWVSRVHSIIEIQFREIKIYFFTTIKIHIIADTDFATDIIQSLVERFIFLGQCIRKYDQKQIHKIPGTRKYKV